MITIIDMGSGNVNSVQRALKHLGAESCVSDKPSDMKRGDKLILPGVGNFSAASSRLYSTGIAEVIREEVIRNKKPLLGICLGMQLLASAGEEGGESKGLDIIKGRVRRLGSEKEGFRLPHIGWNDLTPSGMEIFTGTDKEDCYYFVHSFGMDLEEDIEKATCDYGVSFTAAVKKDNVIGTQFHPEKSQRPGLKVLRNFIEGVY